MFNPTNIQRRKIKKELIVEALVNRQSEKNIKLPRRLQVPLSAEL